LVPRSYGCGGSEEDCGSKDSKVATAENISGLEISLAKNIFGRTLFEDVKDASGELLYKKGTIIDKDIAARIEEATIKLHTAHHLLLAALQEVLGPEVKQRGSNITEERLRIDFSFDRKMTDEEKTKVENIVNDAIKKDYKVVRREMPKDEAEKIGAQMEFGAKYGDTVSVYFIEDVDGKAISKEFCGGPHVEHTGVLGNFKIQKEEASSAGVRRIKGILS
jgi:alanyl-tRNA synthetase